MELGGEELDDGELDGEELHGEELDGEELHGEELDDGQGHKVHKVQVHKVQGHKVLGDDKLGQGYKEQVLDGMLVWGYSRILVALACIHTEHAQVDGQHIWPQPEQERSRIITTI